MPQLPTTADFCSYCAMHFVPGDEVRRHALGTWAHAVCVAELRQELLGVADSEHNRLTVRRRARADAERLGLLFRGVEVVR